MRAAQRKQLEEISAQLLIFEGSLRAKEKQLQETLQVKDQVSLSYSVFHRFRQVKFDSGGSILSSSQFSLLPQLIQKMKLASKVVKNDTK